MICPICNDVIGKTHHYVTQHFKRNHTKEYEEAVKFSHLFECRAEGFLEAVILTRVRSLNIKPSKEVA